MNSNNFLNNRNSNSTYNNSTVNNSFFEKSQHPEKYLTSHDNDNKNQNKAYIKVIDESEEINKSITDTNQYIYNLKNNMAKVNQKLDLDIQNSN